MIKLNKWVIYCPFYGCTGLPQGYRRDLLSVFVEMEDGVGVGVEVVGSLKWVRVIFAGSGLSDKVADPISSNLVINPSPVSLPHRQGLARPHGG